MKRIFICCLLAASLVFHVVQAAETETPEQIEARKKVVEQLDQMNKQMEQVQKDMSADLKNAEAAMQNLQKANDSLMVLGLTGIRVRGSLIGLCGLTGDDVDKVLAKDKASAEKMEAGLTETAKKSYADQVAATETAMKADWDKSSEEKRAKACADIKEAVAKEAAK
ncbi:MAG: hypothetical protein EPN97_07925 [Alphaproteobacteria bacterium]|nr:MAG: hypothetical protein EPN97_07925 [Alphaproteobacteria bacterium]